MATLLLATTPLHAWLQVGDPAPATPMRQSKTAWLTSDTNSQLRKVNEGIAVPGDFRAADVKNGSDVVLSWTNSSREVVEFVVKRQRYAVGVWADFGRLRLWGTPVSFRDAPGPGSYRYQIAGGNSEGISEFGEPAMVTVLDLPPGIATAAFDRNPERPIGMNLDGFSYYSKDWTFVDAFKANTGWAALRAARPWETPNLNGAAIAVDARGYPTQIPQTINGESVVVQSLMLLNAWPYPTGAWVCLYDGDGDLSFDFDATVTSRSPGRVAVNVGGNGDGIRMYLTRSAQANPVRNIRLIMPGFEQTAARHPFHTKFLERLAPFQIIRFLNWGRTNNSIETSWANRTLPTALTQDRETGIAYEYMIDLTNRLGSDPWITVPHLADDNYMRELARLFRDRMSPDRKLYLEFSNEVWNWGFQQRAWAQAQPGSYPESYVRRSLALFRIFEEEFGGTSRLVRVIGGQAVNSSLTQWSLRPAIVAAGGVGNFDAFAIAPYFGHDMSAVTDATTPEQILEMLQPMVDSAINDMTNQRAQASLMQARLICYEGGQHLGAGNNPTRIAQFAAVNRHPLFYNLLKRYHSAWFTQTSEPFVAYRFSSNFNQHGFWGYFENMVQPLADAPKMRAILDAARNVP